jgi:hypothetical protein
MDNKINKEGNTRNEIIQSTLKLIKEVYACICDKTTDQNISIDDLLFNRINDKSNPDLTSLIDETQGIKRSISKLNMIGIRVEMYLNIYDNYLIPYINTIESTNKDKSVAFDLGCINNGNVEVSSDIIDNNKVDLRKLNMNLQSSYTIENIFYNLENSSNTTYDVDTLDRAVQAIKVYTTEYFKGKVNEDRLGESDLMFVVHYLLIAIDLKEKERIDKSTSNHLTRVLGSIEIIVDTAIPNNLTTEDIGESQVETLLNTMYEVMETPIDKPVPEDLLESLTNKAKEIDKILDNLLDL